MAIKTKLGDHLYLWRGRGFSSGICVFSSHGGQTETGDNFVSPIQLGFYQTRNESLVASFNTSLERPNEIVPVGGVCEDYYLSKFQGRHGGNSETYDDIKKFVDENDMAVLSVRNRTSIFVSHKGEMRFSEAIKYLEGGNYGISQIRALFCRVPTKVEYVPSPFMQALGNRDILR